MKKTPKKRDISKKRPSILERELDEEDMVEMKAGDMKVKKDYELEVQCEHSLYIFPKRSRCRIAMYDMQKHRWFERVIIFLIILSTVKLIFDTYTLDEEDGTSTKQISEYLDLFFTISFTLESLIKSIALGFAFDRGSYLT